MRRDHRRRLEVQRHHATLLERVGQARALDLLAPLQPREVYAAIESAGFSPKRYRLSRPDLTAGLPSDDWSARHFIEFMTTEVKLPYSFPIDLDFRRLAAVADMKIARKTYKGTLIRNLIQAQIDHTDERHLVELVPAQRKSSNT